MRKGDKFTLRTTPVFPDPLTEENGFTASLAFDLHEAHTVTLYIFDALGNQVNAAVEDGAKGVNTLRIDASHLAAGMYSFILTGGDESAQGRFVVTR